MSHFVLDASIVLTWCFPDEEAQKAREISERIATGGRVTVPAFWRHEILNALLVGERRKRLTPELVQTFISDLDRLPVDIDDRATASVVFDTTQALCRKYGLTAYDAAYLEIAIRQGCVGHSRRRSKEGHNGRGCRGALAGAWPGQPHLQRE